VKAGKKSQSACFLSGKPNKKRKQFGEDDEMGFFATFFIEDHSGPRPSLAAWGAPLVARAQQAEF